MSPPAVGVGFVTRYAERFGTVIRFAGTFPAGPPVTANATRTSFEIVASVRYTIAAATAPDSTAASAARTSSVGTTFGLTSAQTPSASSHFRA